MSIHKTITKTKNVYSWDTRTPLGPASVKISNETATAWGPGSEWALTQVPNLLGAHDDPAAFAPAHPALRDLLHKQPGLRIGATHRVWEVIFWAVLGQKVQVASASRSRSELCRRFSERAPGPNKNWLMPSPDVIAELPLHDFHLAGVEAKRARTLKELAARATRLEEISTMSFEAADQRLQAFRGVGPWTSGLVRLIALGDADAFPLGDYHLPNKVAWLLAGEARATEARMLELLEPYAGQRGRVFRLIKAAGITAPRHGPKLSISDIRNY